LLKQNPNQKIHKYFFLLHIKIKFASRVLSQYKTTSLKTAIITYNNQKLAIHTINIKAGIIKRYPPLYFR